VTERAKVKNKRPRQRGTANRSLHTCKTKGLEEDSLRGIVDEDLAPIPGSPNRAL
jgi:hypothetical protein